MRAQSQPKLALIVEHEKANQNLMKLIL